MYIKCPDMTNDKKVAFNAVINNKVFLLRFHWNEYTNSCLLDIANVNDEILYAGNHLVTSSVLFTKRKDLPQIAFVHKSGYNYEATPETMKDFVLYYEDSTEQ